MRKPLCAIIGLLIGLPCGGLGLAYIFCALWGTGSHMDGCAIGGLFLGLWPGGIGGLLCGWWIGTWLEQ